MFRGDFSTYLLIPFSVFLVFGTFLHSEGIFSGILFIQEAKREGHSFFVAIARRGTTLALLSALVFKIVLASGCAFFHSFSCFIVFGVVTAGLDNRLLPFYHFGFCSRRSRLGGLGRCKGLLFWDTFLGFCEGSVDWGGNKGRMDGWMDGWMEIGEGIEEGIGGVDLGPLCFF